MTFEWAEWGTPLIVLASGMALGVAALWKREGNTEKAAAEGRRRDLEREREVVVEAIKALETEREKMSPEDYDAERQVLVTRGAAALKTPRRRPGRSRERSIRNANDRARRRHT